VDEGKRKQLVCVHWMRSNCARGKDCDFLHSYDAKKVPICRYYQKDGACPKEKDCIYAHPKAEDGVFMGVNAKKTEQCPYFERGFCKMREQCQFSHITPEIQQLCRNYLLGFCPEGPDCPNVHLKSMLSPQDVCLSVLANFPEECNWPKNHSTIVPVAMQPQKYIMAGGMQQIGSH